MPGKPVEIESVESVEIKQYKKNLFNNNYNDYTRPSDYLICPITLEIGETYTLSAILPEKPMANVAVGLAKDGNKYSEFETSGMFFVIENNGAAANILNITIDSTYTNPKLIVYSEIQEEIPDILSLYQVQLEKGELTEYEQYAGATTIFPLTEPLRSLPNGTKDTIESDGIHRRVGNIILYGNEVWNYSNFESTFFIYTEELGISYKSEYGLSNLFKNIPDTTITANTSASNKLNDCEFAFRSGTTKDRIYFKHLDSGNNVIDFKNWVSSNPIIIQYELVEEVIEPLTEEQQTAYDNIINNGTYKTITNIYSTNEVSPIFEVTYIKDLETAINNMIGGM